MLMEEKKTKINKQKQEGTGILRKMDKHTMQKERLHPRTRKAELLKTSLQDRSATAV